MTATQGSAAADEKKTELKDSSAWKGGGSRLSGYLFIAGAAVMWGTIGVYFHLLHFEFGLAAVTIGLLRATIAALILILVLAIWKRDRLYFDRKLLVPYLLFGLFGIALFYVLNAEAVILTNLATASILLYTAPVFVTLAAWRLWGEPLTLRKIAAVIAAFFGCALVAKAYDPSALSLNLVGIAVAASAGVMYALFTLFSKGLAGRASPWTTVTYSLVFGALFLLLFQLWDLTGNRGHALEPLIQNPPAWIVLLGLSLGPTLGSYALYNAGLRTVPASNASVVATIEPIIALLAGYVAFGQVMELPQIVGAAIIVIAALSLTLSHGVENAPPIAAGDS